MKKDGHDDDNDEGKGPENDKDDDDKRYKDEEDSKPPPNKKHKSDKDSYGEGKEGHDDEGWGDPTDKNWGKSQGDTGGWGSHSDNNGVYKTNTSEKYKINSDNDTASSKVARQEDGHGNSGEVNCMAFMGDDASVGTIFYFKNKRRVIASNMLTTCLDRKIKHQCHIYKIEVNTKDLMNE